MGELSKLPNIGAELEKQLSDVGITTVEELRRVGSREAWGRILLRDPSACIMRLSALEGAIQGIRWHNLEARPRKHSRVYHQYKEPKVVKPAPEGERNIKGRGVLLAVLQAQRSRRVALKPFHGISIH